MNIQAWKQHENLSLLCKLQLSESYIYGTATLDEKDYSINIHQAAIRLVVLPQDFSQIREIDKELISFRRENDNNNKRISMASEIQTIPTIFITKFW